MNAGVECSPSGCLPTKMKKATQKKTKGKKCNKKLRKENSWAHIFFKIIAYSDKERPF